MNEVEKYILQFEPEIQRRLKSIRQLFFDEIPDVKESFRYNMPAYMAGKHPLYYAAYNNHIGFYPIYGLAGMESELAPYRALKTKNSLHFTYDKPLPLELIKKIIRAKLNQ